MARSDNAQLNIRSAYARERARTLAKATGLTTTEVVERALRNFSPSSASARHELVKEGDLLVIAGGNPVTLEETNAAIEEDRNRDPFS